jgi:DNA-binding response OmpR family regulator
MSAFNEATVGVGKNALVVDDEPQIGQIIGRVLEQMGYTVEFALDGEQALGMAQAATHDIIICDLLMPHLNGMALYSIWAERAPAVIAHTIFVTGDSVGTETGEFVRRTGRPCIFKPFRLHDLAALVASVQQAADQPPLVLQ